MKTISHAVARGKVATPTEDTVAGLPARDTLNTAFKIAIVHEDFITGLQAEDVLKRLAARLISELGIDANLLQIDNWEFDWLQDSELREEAIARTAQADMIIVSVGGDAALPTGVRKWIEDALLLRKGGPTAMVALLDGRGVFRSAASRPDVYLRRLSAQYGVDFFCNLDSRQPMSESGIESVLSELDQDDLFAETAYPAVSDYRGWGINE